MNLPISEVFITIILVAAFSRLIRQAQFTAPLRQNLSARSPLLAQLLSCPHCINFWLAAIGALIWWLFFRLDIIILAILVLLGWRGAYYLNQQVDRLATNKHRQEPPACHVCGKPYHKATGLKREQYHFCSYNCWFDLLKQNTQSASRQPLFDTGGTFITKEIYPMSYQDITPTQAQELLASDQGYIYLDVRSVAEFDNGHPTGAYNIPIMHREATGMVPNADFLKIVESHFQRDDKLLVGCLSGARSARAAQALIGNGYSEVANVKGGFGGARTPTGQVVEQGWAELGLPVSQQAAEGKDYQTLAE